MTTYKDQIERIVGASTKLVRYRVESYMSKPQEEGWWHLEFADAPQSTSPLKLIARFKLVCMPGCCGIVISTDAYVYSDYRGRGLGTLLNNMRRQMAHHFGYTLMLCTDVISNKPQQLILHRNGWHPLITFNNRRTGNDVVLDYVDVSVDTNVDIGYNLFDYGR